MKSLNIGFTGPFADANLGDYGMLVNNVLDLSGELRSVEIFTYDQDFVAEIVGEYFPDLNCSLWSVDLGDQIQIDAKKGVRLTPIEILRDVVNYAEVERTVAGLDVLVVNGGGYFNELWCQPHRVSKMLQILVPLLIADDLNIPIIFTGNSYGPFGARSEFLKSILASLRHATFYSRDRVGSTAELRRIGIAEKNIHFVPDDLFLLNADLTHRRKPLDLPASYVVFETYQPIEVLQAHHDELARFDVSMRERGLDVVLLPMYSGRGGAEQAKWLGEEFSWINITLPSGYLPIQEASQVIGGAEILVCDRYHGLVFALANETPALHAIRTVAEDKWYYFRKSLGILETALSGTPFRQRDFMALSPFEALERVGRGLEEIQNTQRKLFDLGLKENIQLSAHDRQYMLDHIIDSGKHHG